MHPRENIRNIAIIAHVDHGKTTLVDFMLRQTGIFRENQQVVTRVLDSNDLERERGITILAKNTAIFYKGTKINIVDTPGHTDFGGEVERTLTMVDGVLLLVDAAEGPLPGTKFVLKKALDLHLKPIVVINKIDRKDARPDAVLNEIFDLFVALEARDDQLDFPVVYAAARDGYAIAELGDEPKDLRPLFRMIVDRAPPPPGDPNLPLRLQVATLDYSEFVGRIAIGRVYDGVIERGMAAVVCKVEGELEPFRVTKLMRFQGLDRVDAERVEAGDIVALAGAGSATVGDTICPRDEPNPMPAIPIDPPTVSMTFLPNTGPFAEAESRYVTSRQIRDRLLREAIANVGLRIEEGESRETFVVSGRGTLHLSVLVETMRREGYAVALSRPQVIKREGPTGTEEPYEEAVVACLEAYSGSVIQKLSQRGGTLEDLRVDEAGEARMRWTVPSRGLIGYRSELLTDTRGTGTLYHVFSHYGPERPRRKPRGTGAMIVSEDGPTSAYSLWNLQERGQLLVGAGVKVYAGQIVGFHSRENDIVVNPCRGKKLTNIRAAGSDEGIALTPPRELTLEQAIETVADDELVEVTPQAIRLRKRVRAHGERRRDERTEKASRGAPAR